jgi:hypothetical protein
LEYGLLRLPQTGRWCVEFGAWDGKYLSNTYYFITRKGYKGVLIEMDPQRCVQLRNNMQPCKALCVNAAVGCQGDDRLDRILAATPIPVDFDLLSIDVDGDDYHIWQAFVEYTPKVVIIEINVRDKPGIDRVNVRGSPMVWGVSGTSIKSMTALARSKGYSLIAHAGCNAINVRNEYRCLFHDAEVSPEDVFTYEGHSIGELTLAEMSRLGSHWPRVFRRSLSIFIPRFLRPLTLKLYRSVQRH